MSKSRPTHELLATIGEYEDRQTGEKNKRRLKIATVFTDEEGRESVRFECLPVGVAWSGWASKFPIRERDNAATISAIDPRGGVTYVAARGDDEDLAF